MESPLYGIICLWSGSVATIPNGWHLCDGTEGTPDLQDKFIIGAGDAFTPGDSNPTSVVEDSYISYYALAYIMKI